LKKIAEYIDGYSFLDFKKDPKTTDAVIRNFEVIGEASRNIPKALQDRYLEMPWSEMYLLRNKVSHEYFGVDYEVIWDVAVHYLPQNKKRLEEIIQLEKKAKNQSLYLTPP
jgi:uncharacterized protein with HEPN domain